MEKWSCYWLTWKLPPYRLAYIVLEGSMCASTGEKQSSIFPAGNALSHNNDWPAQVCPHTGARVADNHGSNQALSIASKAHTSRWNPHLDSLSGINRYQEPVTRQAIGTKRESNIILLFREHSIEWLLVNEHCTHRLVYFSKTHQGSFSLWQKREIFQNVGFKTIAVFSFLRGTL